MVLRLGSHACVELGCVDGVPVQPPPVVVFVVVVVNVDTHTTLVAIMGYNISNGNERCLKKGATLQVACNPLGVKAVIQHDDKRRLGRSRG